MPSPSPDADDDRPPAARSVRRMAAGATVGAIIAFVASLALTAGGSAGGAPPEPRTPGAPVGACLDWTADDGSDVRLVDCVQPHLFQSVGALSLGDVFGPAAAFPSENAWLSMVKERCTPLAGEFLAARFDPFGRYTVGALKPSQQGWRNGDRLLQCGLQVVTRAGELYRVPGDVRSQDQSDVHEPGTCLGIDGVNVGDPVDCAEPHAVEVVGVVDLAIAFPAPDFPDENKQDDAAGPACTTLAAEYAGGPNVVAEKKLTVYWDTVRQDSWLAGTRKVDCKLGALLPDKSGFAPVTGGVRGPVVIGDQPAPVTPETATPGAPAKTQPPLLTVATTVPAVDSTTDPTGDPTVEPTVEPTGG